MTEFINSVCFANIYADHLFFIKSLIALVASANPVKIERVMIEYLFEHEQTCQGGLWEFFGTADGTIMQALRP